MSDQVTLKIDDIEVSVSPGTTVMEAARKAGIDIPHLCFDPDLGFASSSSCRVCVVEIEGARGPVTSCSYPVSPGMVVRTNTDQIQVMRRMIIDLLLSNHPADCLTCDKSGRCDLQEYAYKLGVREPKYKGETVHCEPRQEGPGIVYDPKKCILCARCIDVCHLGQVNGAIDFLGRGFHTQVGLPPGLTREESVCEECGNCVDVCPTGALTFTGEQGKGRDWEFDRVPTICPYCGVGCTMLLNTKDGKLVKITGDPTKGVNRGRLCVKGHFGYDFVNHPDRLTQPLIRRDGQFVPASWDEALDYVASRLSEIKAKHGADALAGLASAKCTNEENYVMQKFVRAVLGTNNVDHCARLCHASTVTGLAKAFGSGAMTNSISDFEKADTIFIIGSNTTECHPVIGAAIKRAAQRGAHLIVADPRAIELTEYAEVWLRQKHGTDVALLNAMVRVILSEGLENADFIAARTEGFDELKAAVEPYTPEFAEKITGVPADDIVRAARMYATSPAASITYSMGITQHTTGTDNVLAVANLSMVAGQIGRPGTGVNPLRGQNNVQGACDMGTLPNVYPGYQRVDDEAIRSKFEAAWGVSLPDKSGLTMVEMMDAALDGRLKAIYIMGENPMLSDPDVDHVEKALKALDLLVVQDIFLTETAKFAHVVLPAASFAEKDGTFVNTERRVQLVRKGLDAPGQTRLDWEIISDVSTRMGYPMSYKDTAAIQEEVASVTPQYGGITHDRLGFEGLQWPCPTKDHPGTPILHTEKFTRGLGKFHPVEYIPARELPDDEYPVLLSTGRILQHYHTGTMTRRSEVLDALVSVGAIEINPDDAGRLGVSSGEMVRVTSRRGEIEIGANVTSKVSPGTAFLAFHYREAPANRLTIAALDPTAKIPEFKVCAVKIARANGKR